MQFERKNIIIKSSLKDLLNNYYVHVDSYQIFKQKQADKTRKNEKEPQNDAPIEAITYITREEYQGLELYAQDDYTPMTQGQLADLCDLRPNSISELVHLRQSSINKGHLIKVATVLNLQSISEIIDFEVE